MKYEAMYSGVLSAAPTVLIGFVLEIRHLITIIGSAPPGKLRWMLHGTVIGTSLSAVLSLVALTTHGDFAESPLYAVLVSLGLTYGITGLTVFLAFSYTKAYSLSSP